MGTDMEIYHLARYIMRYHTGSPKRTSQKQLKRKPTTVSRPTFCFGSLSLPSPCFVSRLAFFVVLLLPMSWTHYRTDRTTSKHQPCPLMTRPATWAHDCFCCVFVFSFFPVSFPLLYLYRMVSVTRYSKHFLGSDIDTYRQYENIAGYNEKSWYDTQ